MTTSYDSLYTLAETSFVAGTDKVFTFTCYAENGIDLLNITGGSATWFLCPYGEFFANTLEIAGVLTDANHFTVTIPAASTLALSGKFIQQISITDYVGDTFRPGQGILIISPAIPT